MQLISNHQYATTRHWTYQHRALSMRSVLHTWSWPRDSIQISIENQMQQTNSDKSKKHTKSYLSSKQEVTTMQLTKYNLKRLRKSQRWLTNRWQHKESILEKSILMVRKINGKTYSTTNSTSATAWWRNTSKRFSRPKLTTLYMWELEDRITTLDWTRSHNPYIEASCLWLFRRWQF